MNRHHFFHFSIFLAFLCTLMLGCEKEYTVITSAEQLHGKQYTIGYEEGHAMALILPQLYPDTQQKAFKDHVTGYEAVRQGKIDAYAFERLQMELAIQNGLTGVRILPDKVGETTEMGVGISPVSKISGLEEKINAFIAEIKSDGSYDDMLSRWLVRGDETMPEIPLAQNPQYHLKIGTTGVVQPYSYYRGTELAGLDIELIRRFALWLGADYEIKVYDYGGIIVAAESGDIDCIFANLNATPERREKIIFSDTLYTSENAFMVRDDGAVALPKISDFNTDDTIIGMFLGATLYEEYVHEFFPKAKTVYYNTDLYEALKRHKIDGFMMDEPLVRYMQQFFPEFLPLRLDVPPMDIAYAYDTEFVQTERGSLIREQLDSFIKQLTADGTLEELKTYWFSTDESKKHVDMPTSGKNGVIRIATEAGNAPFEYVKDGKIVGYEIDILARFCTEYGYTLTFSDMSYDALIPALQSKRADIACGCININDERGEAVSFSEPMYQSHICLAVLDETKLGGAVAKSTLSFGSSLAASFEKTFVRESRWKLVASGIGITVLISILSAILGTILGFGICGLRLSGNKIADGAALVYIRIMQGMPMIVLLMILFYIVFAKTGLDSVWVAVIGFGMNFGAYVSEMIRTGILAVDKGQTEAALALGYSKPHLFVKIVLPQAAKHFLPVFQGEFISLVKMTSVVGYIAIQDLTKASDIIRSRTYEAFFPLVTTAIIYFVIAWLLTRVLSVLQNRIDPKKRKRIVKGVTQ